MKLIDLSPYDKWEGPISHITPFTGWIVPEVNGSYFRNAPLYTKERMAEGWFSVGHSSDAEVEGFKWN
jgi:hypothetical protein